MSFHLIAAAPDAALLTDRPVIRREDRAVIDSLLGDDVRPTPWLAVPVTTAILVAAWAMYRLVEMPGNRLLRGLGTRLLLPKRPAVMASAAPVRAADATGAQ